MLNDIMDAVTCRLDELVPDCTIYTEGVEQGLKEPCFFVGFLEPSERPMLGRRYFRQSDMVIQYLPSKKGDKTRELNQMLDLLMEGMGYIFLADGQMLRGTNKSGKVTGGMLSFFISYNCFGIRPKEQDEPMGDLNVELELGKEGMDEGNNSE